MVWLYYSGLRPAGTKVGSVEARLVVNGRNVTVVFDVWRADMGWEYVAFAVRDPIKEGNVTLPYGYFVRKALEIAEVKDPESLYLEDVEVGTEYGSPDVNTACLEWWIYSLKLMYTNRPLLGDR